MARKKKTDEELMMEQINASLEKLADQEAGSKERKLENDILKDQIELKMALEKQKNDHELALVRANNEAALAAEKQKLDEAKAKSEKVQGWTKIGVRILEVGLFVGMGWLKLRENMTQGRETGSDADPWWRELRHKD